MPDSGSNRWTPATSHSPRRAAWRPPVEYPDFNEEDFAAVISRAKELPSPQDISTLLREVLTPEGKKAICSYLWMIAMADGSMDNAEKKLLVEVAHNMDFDLRTLAKEA